MDANKILNADILDIIFEGRNKVYGAYDLRKTYQKRILTAIAVTFAIVFFLLLWQFIGSKKSNEGAKILVEDVSLSNVKEEKKPEPLPPPPPPKVEPPKIEITKFTPPKIVKDEEVKEDEKPPEQAKLDETTIGKINQEGDKTDVLPPPVVESKGTGEVAAPKVDDDNQTFTSVEIEADFPGGRQAWTKFLERNLDAQTPTNSGAPAGKYTVIVTFIVDKQGNISDVRGEMEGGGNDYGCISEAERIIKKGPSWKPGIQNGRPVKSYKKQRITFIVSED